jgi:hypothetical protein
MAEDMPEDFGFSDTAFRIFILMASRWLKSDRFTDDHRPEIYPEFGLDLIRDNGMKSALLRHAPQLGPVLEGVTNSLLPGTFCEVRQARCVETIADELCATTWAHRHPSQRRRPGFHQGGFQDESRVELDRGFELRQRRRLITAPTTTIGATAATTTISDSGFGVINSRTIHVVIQSVPKATAKSNLGTRFQYRTAKMMMAGAIVAPIM